MLVTDPPAFLILPIFRQLLAIQQSFGGMPSEPSMSTYDEHRMKGRSIVRPSDLQPGVHQRDGWPVPSWKLVCSMAGTAVSTCSVVKEGVDWSGFSPAASLAFSAA